MRSDRKPRKWLRILLWSLTDLLLIIPILLLLWFFGHLIEDKKEEESKMTEYRTARSEEMGDILDFGNYVFSNAHRPHDFRSLIPKVYGEGHDSTSFHFLALEEGRIRGMIAAYPHTWLVGGETLETRFIGTVSVHPYARGAGYMKHLMADVEASNLEQHADLAILGGQRQRYRYFGYETGGISLIFQISRANLAHGVAGYDESLTLIPVEADDTELLDRMYEHYLTRPVTGRSREEFFEVLSTWNGRPYAVFQDTACIGYLVVSPDGSRILEHTLSDSALLGPVLKNYMTDYHDGPGLEVVVRAYESGSIEALHDLAEDLSVTENLQYRVYNWPKVLRAFLRLKHSHEPLQDGEKTLEIAGKGRYRIAVAQGDITVEETLSPAELTLSETQAVRVLTSPEAWIRPEKALSDVNWFPLSFGMSPLDEF